MSNRGKKWEVMDHSRLKNGNIIKLLHSRIASIQTYRHMDSIRKLARVGDNSLAIGAHEWDTMQMVLCCDNEVVDLASGKVVKSSDSDYIKSYAQLDGKGLIVKRQIGINFYCLY